MNYYLNKNDVSDQESMFRIFLLRLRAGWKFLMGHRWAQIAVLAYLVLCAVFCVFRRPILGLDDDTLLSTIMQPLFDVLLLGLFVVLTLSIIALMGMPPGTNKIQDNLRRAGFVNHIGEPPTLLVRQRHANNKNLYTLVFDSSEIPLSKWEDERGKVEVSLNMHIAEIHAGDTPNQIVISAVHPNGGIPNTLFWKDEYLSPENFVLMVGEGLLGPVSINLAEIPHVLLGGATGSGKSVLLKLLLMQAYHKGADIYIADFKRGADFCVSWRQKCHMCFDKESLPVFLAAIVEELEYRMDLLSKHNVSDIDSYNRTMGADLRRIVFACDEIAELLDKHGLSKEEKELTHQIESHLSKIARMGRCVNINLILATQRPDADVLSGQIRSNISCRICGRADDILSRIVLDNTLASELIPENARGRFVMNDGTVFQGFLIDDMKL